MKKPLLVFPAVCFAFLILSASSGLAQSMNPKRPWLSHLSPAAPATENSGAVPASSTNYAFTLISYPGNLETVEINVNKGATTSQQLMVGGYVVSPGSYNSSGFLLDLSSVDGVTTETYSTVNYPGTSGNIGNDINDEGQIVGFYTDFAAGADHGWELSGGKYTVINVPFSGAAGDSAIAINDAGVVVGCWSNSSSVTWGFELSGGVYTNLQVPGSSYTCANDVNDNNEIVGYYYIGSDMNTAYGFTLSGGTYTTVQVPGATATYLFSINDSGEMAGAYCTTSACASSGGYGAKGFVLSGGVYSTVTFPGAATTVIDDINNAGMVTGAYLDSTSTSAIERGFIATPR